MSRNKMKLINEVINIDKKQIGTRIKSIRMQLGETTAEFAKHFSPEASKGTISKWENGRYLPNNERLTIIANLGGMTVDELLYGSIEKQVDFYFDKYFIEYSSVYPLPDHILKKIKERGLYIINSKGEKTLPEFYKGLPIEELDQAVKARVERIFKEYSEEYSITNKEAIVLLINKINKLKPDLKPHRIDGYLGKTFVQYCEYDDNNSTFTIIPKNSNVSLSLMTQLSDDISKFSHSLSSYLDELDNFEKDNGKKAIYNYEDDTTHFEK